jgi:hypothetical protein
MAPMEPLLQASHRPMLRSRLAPIRRQQGWLSPEVGVRLQRFLFQPFAQLHSCSGREPPRCLLFSASALLFFSPIPLVVRRSLSFLSLLVSRSPSHAPASKFHGELASPRCKRLQPYGINSNELFPAPRSIIHDSRKILPVGKALES